MDQGTKVVDGELRTETLSDPRRAEEVFYDGACPVCRAEISTMKRMAQTPIVWRDVSAEGEAVTVASGQPPRSRDELLARFHVRRADGEVVSGAAAFVAMWRTASGFSFLAKVLDNKPAIWVGDRLYWAFLKLRRLWRR